jgi:hypothetical protein
MGCVCYLLGDRRWWLRPVAEFVRNESDNCQEYHAASANIRQAPPLEQMDDVADRSQFHQLFIGKFRLPTFLELASQIQQVERRQAYILNNSRVIVKLIEFCAAIGGAVEGATETF